MTSATTRNSHRRVTMQYSKRGAMAVNHDSGLALHLPTDVARPGVSADLEISDPTLVRDALLTLFEILISDNRFKASDRSDYLAYLLKQGKRASKELWEAQKKYLDRRYAEEIDQEGPLDPLLTVTDDEIAIEVFSADESAYARLVLNGAANSTATSDTDDQGAYLATNISTGTTHLDLASSAEAISQLRGHRQARLTFGDGPAVIAADSTATNELGDERTIKVPYRWVRALGQMQAGATLPATSFDLAPIDLYNVLFTLRTQRAKKSPRALRYELVPGHSPKIVLEPWDLVIESAAGNYEGNRPGVVRTWGRRRLSFLARLLPRIKSVRCHLVGAGLPAFYVFDLGSATLTVALSGWTDSGWAGISTFDLFGESSDENVSVETVVDSLRQGPKTLAELAQAVAQTDQMVVRNAVLASMQTGDVLFDIHRQRFHYRQLFVESINRADLRYRDANEEAAHRLLEIPGQVQLTTVHDLGDEGTRIEGKVEDRQAHRTYVTSFTIDREGRTVDASCTSPQFRRAGLREGPTVPMIALRLFYSRQRAELEKARGTEEGRRLIRAETRMLIGRGKSGATIMRVSLNDRRVVVRWGPDLDQMRMSQQLFGSADDAREEYFSRLARCAERGFIDASAAETI